MATQSPILQLFNESGIDIPVQQRQLETILNWVSEQEKVLFEMLELVYVTEENIIKINREFLDRAYVTDIISFRYDEDKTNAAIEGTLYCCAPRIQEQSEEFAESEEQEFKRIFIHGLLHLIGYEDGSKEQKKKMTSLENKYLKLAKN